MQRGTFWAAALAAMVLNGCGGGGGGTEQPAALAPAAPAMPSMPATPAVPAPVTLSQAGNPIYAELNTYTSWLSKSSDAAAALAADKAKADNIVSWQMPHGGFYKLPAWYDAKWDGKARRSEWTGNSGEDLGTIDNDATVSEIMMLANVYARSGNTAYRDSARKALDFLLGMQYPSGGFPQVYPARAGTSYSNHVTFNDNAMVRVLVLLDHALQEKAPLTGDLFTAQQRARLQPALELATDYIIKAQIVQDGVRTVWCAQHDKDNYKPMGARSYELPSKSGLESVLVTAFLMSRPQTPAVADAAKAAIAWYKRSAVQLKDTAYDGTSAARTGTSPFVARTGSTVWYRFYDLDKDTGFFSGRLPTDNPPGAGKQYDIMKIEAERRYGYQWGGSYGTALFTYAGSVGY